MKMKWYERVVVILTWGVVFILWSVTIILSFTVLPYLLIELFGGY